MGALGGGKAAASWPAQGQLACRRRVAWRPVEGEPAGGVQQPVAKGLGFAGGQVALQAQRLGPDAEVLGDQRELQPDGVEVELAEKEVVKPGLLGGPDAILGVSAAAVQALELDRVAGKVGAGGLEAVPIRIGEGEAARRGADARDARSRASHRASHRTRAGR